MSEEITELKIVNIYPNTINECYISSPEEHLIKLIENGLGNCDEVLEMNEELKNWLTHMPTFNEMPNINEYQNNYRRDDPDSHTNGVGKDFEKINVFLPTGQILFHGGNWFDSDPNKLKLTRYLSTSLGPAFASGGMHFDTIFIITIMSPDIKFYAFDPNLDGYSEAEVLIEKDVTLIKKSIRELIDRNGKKINVIYVEAYKK